MVSGEEVGVAAVVVGAAAAIIYHKEIIAWVNSFFKPAGGGGGGGGGGGSGLGTLDVTVDFSDVAYAYDAGFSVSGISVSVDGPSGFRTLNPTRPLPNKFVANFADLAPGRYRVTYDMYGSGRISGFPAKSLHCTRDGYADVTAGPVSTMLFKPASSDCSTSLAPTNGNGNSAKNSYGSSTPGVRYKRWRMAF